MKKETLVNKKSISKIIIYDIHKTKYKWIDKSSFIFLGFSFIINHADFYKNGKVSEFNIFPYDLDKYEKDSWYKDNDGYLTFKPRIVVKGMSDDLLFDKYFDSMDSLRSYIFKSFTDVEYLRISNENDIDFSRYFPAPPTYY